MHQKSRVAMAVGVLSSALSMLAAIAEAHSIALPGLRAFPESLTSTVDGTLFIGRLGDGGIVRANSRTYWGTGNPGPSVADDRPGDNLYTDSTIALDADAGKIKSYHQYTPHVSWDWDEVSAPLLIDTEVDGKPTKTATHAGRNGYLWVLDRDRLQFLHAFPFSNNNVFTSIDSKTGRPTVDESKRPGAKQGAEFCPSIGGGKDWPPEAWSPQTKLLYIPANN